MIPLLFSRGFRHGVHPGDHKDATADVPIRRMPFVERYVLPLAGHLGRPAVAIVRPGQRVTRGERVAEPGGFVSTALHSPVTGRVVAVDRRRHPNGELLPAIEIEADPYATQRFPAAPPVDGYALDREAFVREVQAGGLVGLGGAAFPSHVKYRLPEGATCRRLVLNGAECEPYLTSDHRLMVERPEAVIAGARLVAHHLGAAGITVGVEANKADGARALERARTPGLPVDVVQLPVKYPQGAEKMLIRALFGVEVPAGKLPLDVGMVVNNVGTMAALADWFERRVPLVERVVTVSGPGVAAPANLLVPIGTPVREVLAHCGGLRPEANVVVMGGPMMGTPLASLDVPVLKGTSGILAFTAAETGRPVEYPCIRCGRCLEACPYFLDPRRLAQLARAGRSDALEAHYALDCVECGSCTYVCPSSIPIVQIIRAGKAAIRRRKAAS